MFVFFSFIWKPFRLLSFPIGNTYGNTYTDIINTVWHVWLWQKIRIIMKTLSNILDAEKNNSN